MTEVELLKRQRAILSNALRTIATNNRTPAWISDICKKEVSKARALESQDEDSPRTQQDFSALEPGDIVRNTDSKDKCVYQLVRVSTTLDGIRLWDIRILKGDERNPQGLLVNNVPENKFVKN